MGPCRAPGEDVAASCTGFFMDGTVFGSLLCLVRVPGPQVPWALREGDPPVIRPSFGMLLFLSDRKDSPGSRQPHPSIMQKRGTPACMCFGWAIFMRISDIYIYIYIYRVIVIIMRICYYTVYGAKQNKLHYDIKSCDEYII